MSSICFAFCLDRHGRAHVLHAASQVHGQPLDVELAGFDFGEIQDVVQNSSSATALERMVSPNVLCTGSSVD